MRTGKCSDEADSDRLPDNYYYPIRRDRVRYRSKDRRRYLSGDDARKSVDTGFPVQSRKRWLETGTIFYFRGRDLRFFDGVFFFVFGPDREKTTVNFFTKRFR